MIASKQHQKTLKKTTIERQQQQQQLKQRQNKFRKLCNCQKKNTNFKEIKVFWFIFCIENAKKKENQQSAEYNCTTDCLSTKK